MMDPDDLVDLGALLTPDLQIDCISDGEPCELEFDQPIRHGATFVPEFIDTDFTRPLTECTVPPNPWYRYPSRFRMDSVGTPQANQPAGAAGPPGMALNPGLNLQAQPLNLSQAQMMTIRPTTPTSSSPQVHAAFPAATLQPLGSVNFQVNANPTLLSPTGPIPTPNTVMNQTTRFVGPSPMPALINVNPSLANTTYISQPIQILSPRGYGQMLSTSPARFVAQTPANLGNAVIMPFQSTPGLLQPQLQQAQLMNAAALAQQKGLQQPRVVGPAANNLVLGTTVSTAGQPTTPITPVLPMNLQLSPGPGTTPALRSPAVPVAGPQQLLNIPQVSFNSRFPCSLPAPTAASIGQPRVAYTSGMQQPKLVVNSEPGKAMDVNSNIESMSGAIQDEPCDLSRPSSQSADEAPVIIQPSPVYSPAPGYVENIDSRPPNLDKANLKSFTDHRATVSRTNQPENVVSAIDLKQRKKERKKREQLLKVQQQTIKGEPSTEVKTEPLEAGSASQLPASQLPASQSPADEPLKAGVTVRYAADGQVPVEFEDAEFMWEEYLEETGAEAAPPASFSHVELSLATGFVKGMKVEVTNHSAPGSCWVASIQMPCGQLLRLRYDGYGTDSGADFWCDMNSPDLHPVGWAEKHDYTLQPPEALKSSIADPKTYLSKALENAKLAPAYLIEGKSGSTPIDQIKVGMRLEVQNDKKPTNVWLARVMENVGGRLLLRYEGTDRAAYDFWLFYLHWRMHPIGWARANDSLYKPPEEILQEQADEAEWPKLLAAGLKEAEGMPLPADIFKDQEEIPEHDFQVGWKLEAVHPATCTQICPATVIEIVDKYWFLVAMDDMLAEDDKEKVQMCCCASSPNIFPIQWSMYKCLKLTPPAGWDKPEFEWIEYLKDCNAAAAPEDSFTALEVDTDFERGMKLEAVNPKQPGQICAATITRMVDRLMWIHLDGSPSIQPNHIVHIQSHDIFPIGWCESNNYPLKPPRKSGWKRSVGRQVAQVEAKPIEGLMTADEFRSATYSQIMSAQAGGTGAWCPKIYFNHKCFSGPFLSKGRIAELPKSVGPGPIVLVMKEVLTMLINVAYKSSRVLREIQTDSTPNPNMLQQSLKAKYKGKSYRAVVEVCKSSDRIEAYCRQVCIKLECCPYLFSPNYINDNCPENCSQLTKTKYTYYYGKKKKRKVGRPPGGHSNLENGQKKPGKRGRKRRKGIMLGQDKVLLEESDDSGNDGKYDVDDDKSSMSSERTEGRRDDDSHDGDYKPVRKKRKYTHHIPPPSLIKTRGARLPKLTFDRRTHKKILVPHPKPPSPKPARGTAVSKAPPPPREPEKKNILKLESNPLLWSVMEVIRFLQTTDCAHLAWMFKEQEIDGQALLLLTLPTIQEHLELKLGPAIKLCHHIETVKIAFYEQFAK